MPQTIWSGNLSFVLVSIPVGIVPAVSPGHLSLRMLHEKEAAPLQRRMVCPNENVIVPGSALVRGFPIDDDEYVIVTEEELDALAPEESRTIEIETFAPFSSIEPRDFERPYYIRPKEGAEKPYRLLAATLAATSKAGIAQFVLRGRKRLVAISAIGDVLCLMTLHFHETRVASKGLGASTAEPSPRDVEELTAQITRATRPFDPRAFHDVYQTRFMELVKHKAEHEGTVAAPLVPVESGEEVDLLALLDESLAEVKGKKSA